MRGNRAERDGSDPTTQILALALRSFCGIPRKLGGTPQSHLAPLDYPSSGRASRVHLPPRGGKEEPHSPHRRNAELRALLDAGRPARGDGLGLGIEADRIRSMLVEIAETGTLPTAERVIGDGHRDRHVDADHADLNLRGKVAGGVAVAGEDRDAVAVFMV